MHSNLELIETTSSVPRDWRGDSSFFSGQFRAAGAHDLAQKIVSSSHLDTTNYEVLERLSLPLLGKLVEIIENQTGSSPRNVEIRSAIYFSLAELLETYGKDETLRIVDKRFLGLTDRELLHRACTLIVDRWTGEFEFSVFLELLLSVKAKAQGMFHVHVQGPGTDDIKKILAIDPSVTLEAILSQLLASGISNIAGGRNCEIHLASAKRGFTLTVEQDIVSIIGAEKSTSQSEQVQQRQSAKGQLVNGLAAHAREQSLCAQLLYLKNKLMPTGKFLVWSPSVIRADDHGFSHPEQFLAVAFLRAMALSRILMPEVPYRRAPISLFGIKLAHVALAFGANDLGLAAIDAETEHALGVPKIEEIVRILNEHGRFEPRMEGMSARVDGELPRINANERE